MEDHSGTITQDRFSYKLLDANTATSTIRFQNVSNSTIWLNTGQAAWPGNGSWKLRVDQCIDETYLPVDEDLYIYGPKDAEYTLRTT